MSELKKNFVQGKMNKDFDVRLVPEGEYIDAFNVLVSNSEGSQVGSVQNSFGIDKITSLNIPSDAETIGACTDESNECIYWAVASSQGSYIYEYDQLNGPTVNSGVTSLVIGDERTTNNVLNFSKQHKITGFNVIYNSFNKQKLLVWTDDLNAIRCINVKRAKGYGVATDANNTFEGKDISLYKRQPHYPPVCAPTTVGGGLENNIKERFLSFGYRWKYLDGEYSSVSTFTNPQFYPGKFALNYQTNENDGMVNKFNAVKIDFNTGDKNVTDVQLVFKESNSNNIWIIDTFNKNKQHWLDDVTQSFTFANNKIYSVLPEDEVNRLFDNVPIVAKAQDFISNRLIYGNYVEGRNMVDNNGFPINVNYDLNIKSENLNSDDIPSNIITNSIVVDSVATNVDNDIILDFSGKSIKKGDLLNITFRATSPVSPTVYGGNYLCSLSMYITSDYSNAYALQISTEFQDFINVVATNNFKNYDTGSQVPPHEDESYTNKYKPFEIIPQGDTDKIQIRIPYIEYKVWNNYPTGDTDPSLKTYVYKKEYFSIVDLTNLVSLSNGDAYSSVKSNRSYEAGIVYLDDEGRYSTIITNSYTDSSNDRFIPVSLSSKKNTLQLQIKHKAPYWAKKYKVFVKDNKLEYQTIYGVVAYKEDNYVWIKLEGQDKNKIAEGDFLIIKKDLGGVLETLTKVQVLEYKQQPSNFINGTTGIAGNYMKLKGFGGLDIDGISNNVITKTGHAQSNGDYFFLYTGGFSNLNTSTNTWEDIPIKGGSKIHIKIENQKYGDDGGYYIFEKNYIAGADYANFQTWFLTEGSGLGPFTNYSFVRTNSGTGALYLKVKNLLNGNGGTIFNNGHPSYMDSTIDIVEAIDLLVFETDPKDKSSEVYYETPDTYLIDGNGNHLSSKNSNINPISDDVDQDGISTNALLNLSFFNCYTQGNGVESYRVKDLFNSNFLSTNTRPNAVELDGYKERREIASLTYSGGYEKTTNYNALNEFNLSRANYKDLDDKYGSIQKLFSRDTDLIVFQEDKIHRVLYNKNLLSDAVGGGQITSVENVLGQEVPFAGEFGIGIDPESFSYFSNNIYFSDQPRGVILRLGADGLEPISRYGMKDWFRDSLREYKGKFVTGGYDPSYDNYIFAFTDEDYIIDDNEVSCNQEISNIKINPNDGYSFKLNMNNKVGDVFINYDVDGEIGIQVDFDGTTVLDRDGYTSSGQTSFYKSSPTTQATVSLKNNSENQAVISLVSDCPSVPELEVTTLVVNDLSDAGKSMRNKYTWVDSTYGYSGESSYDDAFQSSGLTRFMQQVGNESDGPIPFEGSLMRVSSFKISGEYTSCNKIGYIITSDVLDAQEIIDSATYIPVTTVGDENYIEFTFERLGDISKKLYIVWDYIDNVSATNNEIIQTIYLGGTFTINALDYVTAEDPYTIEITTDIPDYGSVSIDGNYITYIHNGSGYFSDYFIYRVTSGGCYVDIRVDILINTPISCNEYALENTSSDQEAVVRYIDCFGAIKVTTLVPTSSINLCAHDITKIDGSITQSIIGPCTGNLICLSYKIFSSEGVNSCEYIDCEGIQQTISVDGTGGYVENYFCASALVGIYNNVVELGDCLL